LTPMSTGKCMILLSHMPCLHQSNLFDFLQKLTVPKVNTITTQHNSRATSPRCTITRSVLTKNSPRRHLLKPSNTPHIPAAITTGNKRKLNPTHALQLGSPIGLRHRSTMVTRMSWSPPLQYAGQLSAPPKNEYDSVSPDTLRKQKLRRRVVRTSKPCAGPTLLTRDKLHIQHDETTA
jgi:hypothetical protein